MAIVGSAEVRINADSAPFERSLDTILNSLTSRLRNAGARAGEDFGRTFAKYVKTAIKDVDSAFKDAGKVSGESYGNAVGKGIQKSMAQAQKTAQKAAEDFTDSTEETLEKGFGAWIRKTEAYWNKRQEIEAAYDAAIVEDQRRTARIKERNLESHHARLAKLQWEYEDTLRQSTVRNAAGSVNVFNKIMSRGVGNAGRLASKRWRDYFDTRTSVGKEARAAANNFVVFFAKGSAGLTIIGTLTAALAQATAGAYALATGLGSAAASSAVLGPSILAIVQAGIVARVAFKGVGEAIKAGLDPEKAEEFAKAMEKLTPAAQNFVRTAIGFREPFRALREVIQERFFTNFTEPFERATTAILPALNAGLSNTAGIAGTLGGQLVESFADTADKAWGLKAALEQNNRFLGIFASETRNLATGELDSFFGQIASSLLKVNKALEPLQMRFGWWLRDLATRADTATTNIDRMSAFFDRAGDRAAVVGSILKNVGQALFGIGSAATAAGATDGVLNGIQQAAINLNNTVKENSDQIGAYIEQARVNLQPLGQLLKDISMAFFELGNTDATGETFNTLRDAIPALKEILQVGVDSGPVFADLIVSVSDFLAALADTGAIEWMFKTLTAVFDVLGAIASSPIFQQIMVIIAPLLGVAKALTLIGLGGKAVGLVFGGSIGKLIDFGKGIIGFIKPISAVIGLMKSMGGAVGLLGRAFSIALGPIGLIIFTVIPLLIMLFKKLWNENEGFRNAILGVWESIKNAISTVVNWFTTTVLPTFSAIWEGIKSAASAVVSWFSEHVVPVFTGIWESIKNGVDSLRPVFLEIWNAILDAVSQVVGWFKSDVLPTFSLIWAEIQAGTERLRPIFETVWNAISTAITTVSNVVMSVINAVWPVLQVIVTSALSAIMAAVEFVFPVIKAIITTVLDGLFAYIKVGFTLMKTVITTVIDVILGIMSVAWPAISFIITNTVTVVWNLIKIAFNAIKSIVEFVMPIVEGVITAAFIGIQVVWNNVLKPLVEGFKTSFEALPVIFEAVKNAIGNIWNGVVDVIKAPIRTVINGINDWLIKPLSKVTGVFGLEIAPIAVPAFADGGLVRGPGGPRGDKILARLSDREFVVNARSTKKFRPLLEAMNRGEMPAIGGPFDWVLDAASGVKNAASDVASVVLDKLQEGAAVALGFVVDKAVDPVISKVRGLGFVGDFIGKIFDKFKGVIREWGSKKDAEAAAVQSGTALPPYLGPADGWTFPLAVKAPATTYPGHNFGAIDFPAAMGTIIRAATSGIVGALISGWGGGYGNNLILSHANGIQTLYAHILSFLVKQGQFVRAGQAIAKVGSTGISTGPHLHFEVRRNGSRMDSWSWLRGQGIALAKGGVVPATPGGMLALIGEAGRNERVEPLDSQGMSVRDRAIIAEVARNLVGSSSGGVNVRVFIGAQELTDIVRYEITENETGNVRKLAVGRRTY